jgi:hypothetical protein
MNPWAEVGFKARAFPHSMVNNAVSVPSPFYALAASDVLSSTAWPFSPLPVKPWKPQGGAPESWFAHRI